MKVANKFAKEGAVILVICNPLQCIDLCSKDLAKTCCLSRVLHDATKVQTFIKIDRIYSIRNEAIQLVELEQTTTAVSMIDTRM